MPESPADTAPATALSPAAALALLVRLVEELSAKVNRDAPELWTREQLAAALNISMSSLAALEASGGIGPQPLRLGDSGRIVRYRVEAVRAWLAAGAPPRQRWAAVEAAAAAAKNRRSS
jgi:hypothetical protein